MSPGWFVYKDFQRLVRQSFAMRRKTLRNNLKASGFVDAVDRLSVAQNTARYLNQRAEELDIAEFLHILEVLKS